MSVVHIYHYMLCLWLIFLLVMGFQSVVDCFLLVDSVLLRALTFLKSRCGLIFTGSGSIFFNQA